MQSIKQYYQHDRVEMLAFIPPSASRTLEVGCGAGYFSAQIKDKLAAETWGVEYQLDAANLAAQKLHRVLAGSVESALPDLPLNYLTVSFSMTYWSIWWIRIPCW